MTLSCTLGYVRIGDLVDVKGSQFHLPVSNRKDVVRDDFIPHPVTPATLIVKVQTTNC